MQPTAYSSDDCSLEGIRVSVERSLESSRYDSFHYISEECIKKKDRECLLTWIVDTSSQLNLSVSTGLLACKYIDNFLNRKPNTRLKILELTGIVALSIAAKYKEGVELDKNLITTVLKESFSINAIITTEYYILETLGWKIGIETACDMIEVLLSYSFENSLSLKFKNTCFAIAALCYCDTDIAKLGTYSISISSIILALSVMNYNKLKDDWIVFIESHIFELDKEKIESITHQVKNKLIKN